MLRKGFIIFPLVFSSFLHLLVIYQPPLYIRNKVSPVIFCWPEIIDKNNLNLSKKNITIPDWVNFSSSGLRNHLYPLEGKDKIYLQEQNLPDLIESLSNNHKDKKNHFYLWDKQESFDAKKDITVPYKIFVSSSGKAVFIYPQKLPLDSQKNLYFQAYLREASFFLNDRFSWTKVEGVIK